MAPASSAVLASLPELKTLTSSFVGARSRVKIPSAMATSPGAWVRLGKIPSLRTASLPFARASELAHPLAGLLASGCASSEARAKGSEAVLRLGIFPNLTHAPGLVAIADGIFTRDLAPTKLEVKVFNSGSEASTALLAGAIDATYIGPGPTVKLFLTSSKVAV